jgi:hypothetical protein
MDLESKDPILIDVKPGSKKLYVIFGGIAQGFGLPPFEFLKTSSMLDGSKLFIRDPSQSWYQNGLPGVADDIHGLADALKKVIGSIDHEQEVFMGNSMGGFGAILFGSMLSKGRVVAFSPQTFITRTRRFLVRDRRWASQIANTYVTSKGKEHIYDLRIFLIDRGSRCRVEVHYCSEDRLDRIHADRLRGLPNIEFIDHKVGGHHLVKSLRDSGKLLEMIG